MAALNAADPCVECVALSVVAWGDETGPVRVSADAVADSPVIAQPERANAYPEAQVSGELTLRDGCLFVGPNLVVWPYGATWDDAEEAVTFNSPPFDEAPATRVGRLLRRWWRLLRRRHRLHILVWKTVRRLDRGLSGSNEHA